MVIVITQCRSKRLLGRSSKRATEWRDSEPRFCRRQFGPPTGRMRSSAPAKLVLGPTGT